MNAFIIAITLMCQNHKLTPQPLPGQSIESDVVYLKTVEEKSCLKKLYNACNLEVSTPDPKVLRDCLAKNI